MNKQDSTNYVQVLKKYPRAYLFPMQMFIPIVSTCQNYQGTERIRYLFFKNFFHITASDTFIPKVPTYFHQHIFPPSNMLMGLDSLGMRVKVAHWLWLGCPAQQSNCEALTQGTDLVTVDSYVTTKNMLKPAQGLVKIFVKNKGRATEREIALGRIHFSPISHWGPRVSCFIYITLVIGKL